MKTRLLIIIVVVIVISFVMSFSYYAIYDSSTDVFILCTPKYEKVGDKCIQLKPEQYCKDWCDLEELSKLGCNEITLDYVYRATNLFDEEFADIYLRNAIGLPDGISEKEFEMCANTVKEKRLSMNLEKLDSEQQLLDQLRKTPRIETLQNFTDTASDFVVSEALHNSNVSDLLSDYEYEIKCCTFSADRDHTSYNRYVGLVFDVPEKYMKVVITYDLTKQQISGAGTEILVEDGIIKVGNKENEN